LKVKVVLEQTISAAGKKTRRVFARRAVNCRVKLWIILD
jgi:hypothetical protein